MIMISAFLVLFALAISPAMSAVAMPYGMSQVFTNRYNHMANPPLSPLSEFHAMTQRWSSCNAGPAVYMEYTVDDQSNLYTCGSTGSLQTATYGELSWYFMERGTLCSTFFLFEITNTIAGAGMSMVFWADGVLYVVAGNNAPNPGTDFRVNAFANWRSGTCSGYENDYEGTDSIWDESLITNDIFKSMKDEYVAYPFTAMNSPSGMTDPKLCVLVTNEACKPL